MNSPDTGPAITVRLRIRGGGDDDNGILTAEFSIADIDWSLADAPRERVRLADVYQVDISVGLPDQTPETDTWDRA
jgi:hypothetical protein